MDNVKAALARSQELLEKLTYGEALAEAFEIDLFFEVRGGGAWSAPEFPTTRSRREVLLAQLALAFAAGGCATLARNWLSADLIGLRTAVQPDPLPEPPTAAFSPTGDAGAEQERAPADRLAAFRAAASGEGPVARIESMLSRGESRLPVVFSRQSRGPIPEAAMAAVSDEALQAREDRVLAVLRIALSETIPSSMLTVERAALHASDLGEASLDVRYAVRFDERAAAPGLEMVYDVRWRVRGFPDQAFRLDMPPPSTPIVAVRERSLFPALGGEPVLSRGGIDTRMYAATTARAFDRLYDELFALFYKGDPVVPLSLAEQLGVFAAPAR
jgi:hypothetical protein